MVRVGNLFRGLISLFTSGLIFNPMVFGGIILGFVIVFNVEEKQLFTLYKDYQIYLLALFFAFIYNFIFKPVYNEGGRKLDWVNMLLNILGGAFMFVFSSILTISFVWMVSF